MAQTPQAFSRKSLFAPEESPGTLGGMQAGALVVAIVPPIWRRLVTLSQKCRYGNTGNQDGNHAAPEAGRNRCFYPHVRKEDGVGSRRHGARRRRCPDFCGIRRSPRFPPVVPITTSYSKGERWAICAAARKDPPRDTKRPVLVLMAAKGLDQIDAVLAEAIGHRLIHSLLQGKTEHKCAVMSATK
jgi:hypothetical protein